MQQVAETYTVAEPKRADDAVPPVLDLRHLARQTLGDSQLKAIVLGLFVDESPRYRANIVCAADVKAWRMAVHTLKGVALNIGAFRLAQLCKHYEAAGYGLGNTDDLTSVIETTLTEIRRELA